jgi:hypothetical protein
MDDRWKTDSRWRDGDCDCVSTDDTGWRFALCDGDKCEGDSHGDEDENVDLDPSTLVKMEVISDGIGDGDHQGECDTQL